MSFLDDLPMSATAIIFAALLALWVMGVIFSRYKSPALPVAVKKINNKAGNGRKLDNQRVK